MSQLSSVEPETIRCPHSNCQIMQYDKPGRDHCIRCRRPLRVDVDAPEFELEPEPPEPEPPEDDLTRYLASELQEIRLVRGLSQQEAAEAMDVPRTYCTKIERARTMGIIDPHKKYDMKELASGDVVVAATGVTDGALIDGVRFHRDVIETETVIYRSLTGTVRRIRGEHRELGKFRLD